MKIYDRHTPGRVNSEGKDSDVELWIRKKANVAGI